MTEVKTRAWSNANAHLEHITNVIRVLDETTEPEILEMLHDEVMEYPLSCEIRSGWAHAEGKLEPSEYQMILTMGGPACRVTGELNEHGEPVTARIEHQDWGTPWCELPLNPQQEEILVRFANLYYWGEV